MDLDPSFMLHAPPLQAIPLLLYAANLKRMLTETGRLLPAFFLGSATTVIGSLAAWLLLPLGKFLGEAGWQVKGEGLLRGGRRGITCGGVKWDGVGWFSLLGGVCC
jgi:hypothetical protein